MKGNQWYYQENNQQKGPVSESTLRELLEKKILGEDTLVWSQGMSDWNQARNVFFEGTVETITPPANTESDISDAYISESQMKKTPVILTIIYTIITVGIYYPIWFLTRRDAINRLKSKEKLGKGIFVFGIVMFSISVVLVLFSGFIEGLSEGLGAPDLLAYAKGLDAIDNIINLVVGILLLVQCFKVKRIFNEHFNKHLKRNIPFSGVAVFFFQIYYLQYKINRF